MAHVRAGQAVVLTAVSLVGPFTVAFVADAVSTTGPERLRTTFTTSLKVRHSGKCADVAGWSTADGANVQQWTCGNDQGNQHWRFVATGDGYYTLRAVHSGKCLDGAWSTADGGNVQQWTCGNDQINQQWRLVQKDNGYFAVVNRHSGKCLDVARWSTADGGNVQERTCDGQDDQQWRLA